MHTISNMRAVPGEGKPASQRAGAESMRAQRAEFENEEPKLAAQIRSLQRELEEKRAGENTLDKAATGGAAEFLQNKKLLRGLRKTDNGSPEKRYE